MNSVFEATNRTIVKLAPPLASPEMAVSDLKNSLMQVLRQRKSHREFSDREINVETLSRLLWAAFGINRPEEAHRTAPSGLRYRALRSDGCAQPAISDR